MGDEPMNAPNMDATHRGDDTPPILLRTQM